MHAYRERAWAIPSVMRVRRETTEDWEQLRPHTTRLQEVACELPRHIVLFRRAPAASAVETGVPEWTLRRLADRFDAVWMASFVDAPAVR